MKKLYRNQWVTEHNSLAKREIAKIRETILARDRGKKPLPSLPSNLLEWVGQARPIVERRPRNFLAVPFWEEIYKDDFACKMILGGRQTYKSTYVTDLLACDATSVPGSQVCYVSFSQQSQSAFSKQKLQIGTFSQNPILGQFPRSKLGNVGEISLKNDSTIYCTTDTGKYKNVEGKSLNHCILDEAQYQHMEEAPRVVQTMMATKGKLTITGIGGQAGSAYEDLWNKSDQREWVYDDQDWRKRLQFGEHGLVIGDYLKDVLAGKWVPKKPENKICHGYHLPQPLFPTIPLTIDDATLKYRVSPMYSIEYQRKYSPMSVFTTNTMAEFYKAANRPVTAEMVQACMNPYKYLGLLKPDEIAQLKETYQDKIKITMGVDFGSGYPSNTVIAIMIQWKREDGQNRYHLAYIDKRPAENQLDQAEHICNLFKKAKCDLGVGDLGYGAIQVKIIQDGSHSRHTGVAFSGVGSNKFLGCRTISDETKNMEIFDDKIDEHGDQTGRISIDKTTAIQEFVDMFEVLIPHPTRPNEHDLSRPKFMIPSKNEHEVDWLIKDFAGITRKDLVQTQNSSIDSRQRARKEFNHPKDSVMAIIYAKKAQDLDLAWNYV